MFLQKGFTIWFTGISGSGKTTLSNLLHRGLQESGTTNMEVLDGEDIKIHLSKGLGFTKEDRDTRIRRIGWVAHLLTRNNSWTHEPYEMAHNPEVHIKTDMASPREGVEMILKHLRQAGLIL